MPANARRGRLAPNDWKRLETYLLSTRDLGPSTTDKVLRYLRILEREGISLWRPSRVRFERFIAQRKRAGRDGPGQRHYYRALRHVLAWRKIHWPDFRLPRYRSPRRAVLRNDVVARLMHYGEDRADDLDAATARFVFVFDLYQGLRPPGELVDLDLDDVDLRHRELRVWSEKLDVYEPADIFPWIVRETRAYIRRVRAQIVTRTRSTSKAFILNPRTGKRFTNNAFRMWLGRHARRVYRRFRPYDMRHWSGTWVLRETNGNLEAAKHHLRHHDIKTTMTYDHLTHAERSRMLLRACTRQVTRKRVRDLRRCTRRSSRPPTRTSSGSRLALGAHRTKQLSRRNPSRRASRSRKS